jgi:dTDP-4-dehydrorhamnose reductase
MRILVTGGEGMLGRALDEALRGDLTALGRSACDVSDARSVGTAFEAYKPDVVVHAAAWTDVDGCESDEAKARLVNTTGTLNVAQAAQRRGARLIVISTDYVFAGNLGRPLTEDDPTGPASVYGRTKLAGEGAAILHHDAPLILRTCGVYARGGKNFPRTIARRVMSGEHLRVVDDQHVSPTYALDLAHAIIRLIRMPTARGIFHAANSGVTSWYNVARAIAALLGKPDHPIEPISSRLLARPAPRPAFSALECTKLSLQLGVVLRPWDEALNGFFDDVGGKLS